MSEAIAMPGNTAATFLTHFFGPGLADDRYVVEKFRALADGNIRRCSGPAPKGGRRRAAKAVPRSRGRYECDRHNGMPRKNVRALTGPWDPNAHR